MRKKACKCERRREREGGEQMEELSIGRKVKGKRGTGDMGVRGKKVKKSQLRVSHWI